MATVIDELIVRLNLDPSGFTKGQKDAAQSFLKTKNAAASTAKDMEGSGKKAGEFFSQLRGQVILLFAAFAGGKSIKQFVADLTSTDALLGRVATIMGTTTQELSKWQGAVEAMGGSASGAANSMASLDRQLVNISLIPGSGDAIIPYLRALKVSLQGANGDIKTATELLPELNAAVQGMDKRRAASLLAGIGLNQDLINIVLLSRTEFKAAMADQEKYGLVTKEQSKAAQEFQKAWNGVYKSFETLGRVLLTSLTPGIIKTTKYLTDMFVWLQSHPKELENAFIGISAAVAALGLYLGGPIAAVALLATAVAGLYLDWTRWNETGKSAFGDFWLQVEIGWYRIEYVARKTWDSISGTVLPIIESLKSIFVDNIHFMVDEFKLFYSLFFGTTEEIKQNWENVVNDLRKLWDDVWDGFAKAVYNATPAIWAAIKRLFGWAIDRANTVWRAITGHNLINESGGVEKDDQGGDDDSGASKTGSSVGAQVGRVIVAKDETERRQKWVASIRPAAEAEAKRLNTPGITADAIIAQAATETGWGKASIGNNIFGVHADKSWHGPVTHSTDKDASGKTYSVDYRAYPNVEASIKDHSDFIKKNTDVYAGGAVMNAQTEHEYFLALKKGKYAESKDYVAANDANLAYLKQLKKSDNKEAITNAIYGDSPDAYYPTTPKASDIAASKGGGSTNTGGTSTTQIDTLNVYSQSSDAAGIAKDIRSEITRRDAEAQIANQGFVGAEMAFANIISDLAGGGPNLLTADLVQLGLIAPQWGIFNSAGKSVVAADSVGGIEYKQEWRISDYPLEQGAFESYNKVSTPFDARVNFVTGGSFANRQAFLASIAAIAGDLKLYSVVTPEKTYPSVNIGHYDYSRSDGLIGLIKVSVWLTQINVSTGGTLSNTQQPSGATPASQGQVQPAAPTPSQTSTFTNAYQRGEVS